MNHGSFEDQDVASRDDVAVDVAPRADDDVRVGLDRSAHGHGLAKVHDSPSENISKNCGSLPDDEIVLRSNQQSAVKGLEASDHEGVERAADRTWMDHVGTNPFPR